jgi:hypothetical protein
MRLALRCRSASRDRDVRGILADSENGRLQTDGLIAAGIAADQAGRLHNPDLDKNCRGELITALGKTRAQIPGCCRRAEGRR